jgi:hypothetical protein
MIHCESEEAFLQLTDDLTSKWAVDVASYFQKDLKSDILERSGLGFHFLQTFEHSEIMRGLAGIGDYHLKAEFSRTSIPPEELVLPKKIVAPSDIISYHKAHAQDTQENKSSVLDQSSDKDDSVLSDTNIVQTAQNTHLIMIHLPQIQSSLNTVFHLLSLVNTHWQNMFWTTSLLHWSLLRVLSLFMVGVGSTVSRCFLRRVVSVLLLISVSTFLLLR